MVYFLSGLSGLGSCRVIDRIPKFLRGQINIQSIMERIYEYESLVFHDANAYFTDILPGISQPRVPRLQIDGSLLIVCL